MLKVFVDFAIQNGYYEGKEAVKMNETFSVLLKFLRKEKNKTQDDVATFLGVRRSTYGISIHVPHMRDDR